MQMPIKYRLEQAECLIKGILQELDSAPEKSEIAGLLAACDVIDEKYKEFCDNHDDFSGEEAGTTYKNGINIEFEIEADWWHDVSLLLRKLRENK